MEPGRTGDPGPSAAMPPNLSGPPDVSDPVHALAADVPTMVSPLSAVSAPSPIDRSVGAATDDQLGARRVSDFDTLFAAHYERLVRTLSVVAGDPETAADAVQEAFVKAHLRWRKISRYDDPIGWIRRVAINQIHDGHRRGARKQRAMLRMASRYETVTHPAELDEFDRLLATLPKQQRAATALFYVDGLSVAEIAVALDLAEGSVKSHLHDARRRLRPVLEREAAASDGPPPGRDTGGARPATRSPWDRP